MNLYAPRLFDSDVAIRRIGEGLLERTLPREDWTHEAHLAACIWLVRERPDIDIERALPEIIAGYNRSVGGINDDTQGYHETITQVYVRTARAFAGTYAEAPLQVCVNAILAAPEGRRDWPLRFYSRERLFSVQARREFIAPDLAPLPPVA